MNDGWQEALARFDPRPDPSRLGGWIAGRGQEAVSLAFDDDDGALLIEATLDSAWRGLFVVPRRVALGSRGRFETGAPALDEVAFIALLEGTHAGWLDATARARLEAHVRAGGVIGNGRVRLVVKSPEAAADAMALVRHVVVAIGNPMTEESNREALVSIALEDPVRGVRERFRSLAPKDLLADAEARKAARETAPESTGAVLREQLTNASLPRVTRTAAALRLLTEAPLDELGSMQAGPWRDLDLGALVFALGKWARSAEDRDVSARLRWVASLVPEAVNQLPGALASLLLETVAANPTPTDLDLVQTMRLHPLPDIARRARHQFILLAPIDILKHQRATPDVASIAERVAREIAAAPLARDLWLELVWSPGHLLQVGAETAKSLLKVLPEGEVATSSKAEQIRYALLSHDDPGVRDAALRPSLEAPGNLVATFPYERYPELWQRALELASEAKRGSALLVAMLGAAPDHTDSIAWRWQCLDVLADVGDPRALPILQPLTKGIFRDGGVKARARTAVDAILARHGSRDGALSVSDARDSGGLTLNGGDSEPP